MRSRCASLTGLLLHSGHEMLSWLLIFFCVSCVCVCFVCVLREVAEEKSALARALGARRSCARESESRGAPEQVVVALLVDRVPARLVVVVVVVVFLGAVLVVVVRVRGFFVGAGCQAAAAAARFPLPTPVRRKSAHSTNTRATQHKRPSARAWSAHRSSAARPKHAHTHTAHAPQANPLRTSTAIGRTLSNRYSKHTGQFWCMLLATHTWPSCSESA